MMQRLWSRTASVQTARVSCPSTSATGVAPRWTTAAGKRRFRFANSVTAFYSSIFAGAALADATAKDARRAEWQEKIAAVNEEVSVLVDEEKRLLSTIESRRRRRFASGTLQTRSYNTAVPSPGFDMHGLRDEAAPNITHYDENDGQFGWRDTAETESEFKAEEEDDDDGVFVNTSYAPRWLADPEQKAVRLLALKQLAIRFLLRPSIAHNYSDVPMNYSADFEAPPMSVSDLLTELNRLRKRVQYVKEGETESIDDVVQDLRSHSFYASQQVNTKLDNEVDRDTGFYLTGQMSLQELLLRLAANLTQSTDPDRPVAFKYMLIAFTQTRQNDLGALLLRTLLPHGFLLNSPLIITILHFLRKSKDLKNFDLFLRMLREGEGYPVNLGKMPFFKRQVISGIELTVPPLDSSNPVLYSALISAALRFDQPERADAYLQAARATGFMDDYSTLFAYMRFYGIRKDWRSGLNTLRRAVAYMGSTGAHIPEQAERLVVIMVQLCDTCEQYGLSEGLIKAAVHSGFDPGIAEKQSDIESPTDPDFERWHNAVDESELQDRPLGDKYLSFAQFSGAILSNLGQLPDPAKFRQETEETLSQTLVSAVLEKRQPNLSAANSEAETTGTLGSVDAGGDPGLHQNTRNLVDKQDQEIMNLKAQFGQMHQTLDQTLSHYRSTIKEQKKSIASLKHEIRTVKKSTQTAVEWYQAYATTCDKQSREIKSLTDKVSDIRRRERNAPGNSNQVSNLKAEFILSNKPQTDSPNPR